jgi:putative acetyltransferase
VTALLRAAEFADSEALAALWHQSWHDAHALLVPAAALAQRRLADFRARVQERLPHTTVAVVDSGIAGFATLHDDQLEQLYLAEAARGTGVAGTLIEHAERSLLARFDRAWLSVAAGNLRARRFYARHGWRDVGGVDYRLETADGGVIVRARRYEKWLRS